MTAIAYLVIAIGFAIVAYRTYREWTATDRSDPLSQPWGDC